VSGQSGLLARFPDPGTLFFADELVTHTIPNVEILSTGTWTTMTGKTVTITDHDLQSIAATFGELKDRVKPFFKLGHEPDSKQSLITGAPAMGWLQNVRAIGGKLVTDLHSVPDKVYQLIKAGAFRRISAEVARDWTDPATGKMHSMVLKAAGLLGATAPAINTLNDIMSLYGLAPDGELLTGDVFAFTDPKGETEMDPKELQAAIDAAVAKALTTQQEQFSDGVRKALGIDEKTDPLTAIASLKKTAIEAASAVETANEAKFAGEVDEIITKAKKDGKLLPSGENAVRLMVRGWVREAADNEGTLAFAMPDPKTKKEKQVRGSVLDCLTQYFASLSPVLAVGREFGGGRATMTKEDVAAGIPRDLLDFATEGHKPTAFDAPSLERDAVVKEYMREHKITDYFKAFCAVNGIETRDAVNE
jgi:hypothetical protein